jgi:hypothetical protein
MLPETLPLPPLPAAAAAAAALLAAAVRLFMLLRLSA